MGSSKPKKRVAKNSTGDYISWFEIPAFNFIQAVNFYSSIYDIQLEKYNVGELHMAVFPTNSGIGGAVVSGPGCIPSDTGPLLYLNGGTDLNNVLSKVELAGGRIVLSKTLINEEAGYFAIFIDTEGNKLALHSNS